MESKSFSAEQPMSLKEMTIRTHNRTELVDITAQVAEVIKENKMKDGLVTLFVPHTTAAITINENADPSVKQDILSELNRLVPFTGPYTHREGNSAAHVKSTLVGSAQLLLVEGGRLQLGTWQGIYFCEFDGPRTRKVWIKTTPS
jgi:secondary thiamine-phosphate synthase enzyme